MRVADNACVGVCLGVSIACKVLLALNQALPEHRKALRAYEAALADADVVRAHLGDSGKIQETLAERPELYLRFLQAELTEIAKRIEGLGQVREEQLKILAEHKGRLDGLQDKFADNPALLTYFDLEHRRKYHEAKGQLGEAVDNLALCEAQREVLAWQVEKVKALIERLGQQKSAVDEEVGYLSAADAADAAIAAASALNDQARREILAVLMASEEIFNEMLERFAARAEVKQITVSLDLAQALEGRREKILAGNTHAEMPE